MGIHTNSYTNRFLSVGTLYIVVFQVVSEGSCAMQMKHVTIDTKRRLMSVRRKRHMMLSPLALQTIFWDQVLGINVGDSFLQSCKG